MWLVTAPFEQQDDRLIEKTRLLLTGKSHTVGRRKENDIALPSKKVSHFVGELIVDAMDTDDTSNRPKLRFSNLSKKGKPLRIPRASGAKDQADPEETKELHHGDKLVLATDAVLEFEWKSICCFNPKGREKIVSANKYAPLGIHLTILPDANITHHITSTYSASPLMANSLLLSCQFVTPEWLAEVVRSVEDKKPPYVDLPNPSKYRPEYADSLSDGEKTPKTWEPNEERMHMFKDWRFLFVGEKGREVSTELKTAILTGSGNVESFNVHDGRAKFAKALQWRKGKENLKMAVVADAATMVLAIGRDKWQELVDELHRYDFQFITPADIVKAVIDVDLTLLTKPSGSVMDIDQSGPQESFPINGIPSTFPEERSAPSTQEPESEKPKKRLLRRAVSKQPSVEPEAAREPEPPVDVPSHQQPAQVMPPPADSAPARRRPTKRLNKGQVILTGDDDSVVLEQAMKETETAASSVPVESQMPPPPRVAGRKRTLVRRADRGLESVESEIFGFTQVKSEEPLYKKYKGLFDETNPDNVGEDAAARIDELLAQSQTQAQDGETQMDTGRSESSQRRDLQPVPEEEEESQGQTQTGGAISGRSLKRKATTTEDAIDMATVEETLGMTESERTTQSRSADRPPPSKRRAVEDGNAVERSQPSIRASTPQPPPSPTQKKAGAEPGHPDTDQAFLKALASKKRGKKTEDEFDRDFNKLKISKPDLQEDVEEDWKVLEYKPDEWTSKGNFMVVVEMDIVRGSRRENVHRAEWDGLPNFKKFKKTKTRTTGAKVELAISEQNDYGIGKSYWKHSQSQSLSQGPSQPPKKSQKPQPKPVIKKRVNSPELIDSEDELPPTRHTKTKASSRAGSVAPPPTKSTRTRKTQAKSQPLFLSDEDEDIKMDDTMQDDEDVETLASSAQSVKPPPKKAPSKKRKAIVVDDGSDSDGVFKGFKAGSDKRPTKRR